jgi:hypothetical protein
MELSNQLIDDASGAACEHLRQAMPLVWRQFADAQPHACERRDIAQSRAEMSPLQIEARADRPSVACSYENP